MGFTVDPGKAPQSPQIFPIDIPATEQAAINADTLGLDTSMQDYATRLPGMVQSRDSQLKSDLDALTGPLNPTVQNTFMTGELGNAMSAFGGGSSKPNVTGKGSIGRNTIGAGYANDVNSYQDNARQNVLNDLAMFPEPGIGLSGSDAANLAISNTTNLNQANQLALAAKVAQQNAQTQADNAKKQTEIGVGTSIAGAVISKI